MCVCNVLWFWLFNSSFHHLPFNFYNDNNDQTEIIGFICLQPDSTHAFWFSLFPFNSICSADFFFGEVVTNISMGNHKQVGACTCSAFLLITFKAHLLFLSSWGILFSANIRWCYLLCSLLLEGRMNLDHSHGTTSRIKIYRFGWTGKIRFAVDF